MKHEIPRWVNSAYDRRRSEQAVEREASEGNGIRYIGYRMFWMLASTVNAF